mmetsp:Transcript_102239/g.288844  ORF Transcript_102239/g.288844 Transcript_102239/m.288844 type:complete len:252 (+) Transcript_102239:120-875(+)
MSDGVTGEHSERFGNTLYLILVAIAMLVFVCALLAGALFLCFQRWLESAARPSVYGEITPDGLSRLLTFVARKAGLSGVDELLQDAAFIDVGSGKGRTLVFVGVSWPNIRFVAGIESDEQRHLQALELVSKARRSQRAPLRVRLVPGDAFEHKSWECALRGDGNDSESDNGVRRYIVLANTLCFDEALQVRLLQRIEAMIGSNQELFVLSSKCIEFLPFNRRVITWHKKEVGVSWSSSGETFQIYWMPKAG